MTMLTKWLYRFPEKTEHRFGLYSGAFILSLVLLGIACIYNTPHFSSFSLGEFYEELSNNPFVFNDNPLQYRVLTPFIAYCLFLRGPLYIIVPLLSGLLLLSSIYIYFRKKDFHSFDAFLVTALIAFSSPILFQLHFQGYVDTTSYFLVFMTYVFIERKQFHFSFLFYALALLNHEINTFAAPFLLWMCFLQTGIKRSWKPLLFFAISWIPVILYRRFIDTHTDISSRIEFYLNYRWEYLWLNIGWNFQQMYRLMPLGIFMCFKLFWLIPIFAIYKKIRERSYKDVLTILLMITCGCAPLVLASDTSRIVGLCFIPILVSVKYIKQYFSDASFTKYLSALLLLNFMVPAYYVGQTYLIPYYPLPVYFLNKLLLKFFIIL